MILDTEAFIEQYGKNELFLEHFGKKGMRWGVRKAKRGDWKIRSASQKAGLVAGGFVGAKIGSYFAQRMLLSGSMSYKKLAIATTIVLASIGASTVIGVRATRTILQKDGKMSYKKFEKTLKKNPEYETTSVRQEVPM